MVILPIFYYVTFHERTSVNLFSNSLNLQYTCSTLTEIFIWMVLISYLEE